MQNDIKHDLNRILHEYIKNSDYLDQSNLKSYIDIFVNAFKSISEWSISKKKLMKKLSSQQTKENKEMINKVITYMENEKLITKIPKKITDSKNEIKILHLSDIQIGRDIDRLLFIKLNEVLKNLKDIKIDYVFITGDLTSEGEKDEFAKFKLFLYQLNGFFPHLKKEDIIIIPGNHDLNRRLSKIQINLKYKNFNNFIKEFYGYERKNFYVVQKHFNNLTFPIIALDSNTEITHNPLTYHRAFITGEQIGEIIKFYNQKEISTELSEDQLKIYCVHHPPYVLENFDIGILRNLCKGGGLHIIFHGHTHSFETPTILYTRDNKIIMAIGCGSPTTKAKKRLPGQYSKAQFNLVTLKDDSPNENSKLYNIRIKSYILDSYFELKEKNINEYLCTCNIGDKIEITFKQLIN